MNVMRLRAAAGAIEISCKKCVELELGEGGSVITLVAYMFVLGVIYRQHQQPRSQFQGRQDNYYNYFFFIFIIIYI